MSALQTNHNDDLLNLQLYFQGDDSEQHVLNVLDILNGSSHEVFCFYDVVCDACVDAHCVYRNDKHDHVLLY